MVFIDIMMKMEIQLQKNYRRVLTTLLLILATLYVKGQSCVCYQNHFLNDYKEADFIAQITISEVYINYREINEDKVSFTITQQFKGNTASSLFITQSVGNSSDNSRCRLFLKPGDEVIIFAQIIDGVLITTPCKRNSFIYKHDPKFESETTNLIGKLSKLSSFNDQINSSSINCGSLEKDTDVIKEIGQIKLSEERSYFGLYNIKFTDDDKIKLIGVVSPFNKIIDKKIRIMLIKKKWDICELNENRELLVAYFYHPATTNRKAYLSTF